MNKKEQIKKLQVVHTDVWERVRDELLELEYDVTHGMAGGSTSSSSGLIKVLKRSALDDMMHEYLVTRDERVALADHSDCVLCALYRHCIDCPLSGMDSKRHCGQPGNLFTEVCEARDYAMAAEKAEALSKMDVASGRHLELGRIY